MQLILDWIWLESEMESARVREEGGKGSEANPKEKFPSEKIQIRRVRGSENIYEYKLKNIFRIVIILISKISIMMALSGWLRHPRAEKLWSRNELNASIRDQ